MTIDEQMAYLLKGAADVINEEELRKKLEKSQRTGKPLTVKVGFDPTAPDLHLGHTVLIRKMKHFQDLGHRVIFLIGDFTGLIGDPTGRNKTRPPLSREAILSNAETYKKQVFKILDAEKTVVDFNSRWLGALTSEEWIRLCAKYTVARMLERDEYAKRMANNQPISIHELLYPLAQAYDSVALQADFELGGTDQKFNLLVGRDIQREYGLEPQVLLMTPILEGLDGVEKMSKSLKNYVGIMEAPEEIFGKVMSITDQLMWRYYELLTDLPYSAIEKMKREVESGAAHPMQVKADLAYRVVSDFHSGEAAEHARAHFSRVFQRREDPEEMLEFTIPLTGNEIQLADLISQVQFAPSKSEARRLIKSGGVSIDGNKVEDPTFALTPDRQSELVLRVGKRKFGKVKFTAAG
ncbi:MAG: tyrosine--tRNA ligase [Acidobacteria bacterium]|nr:MAG: tyrosine--tRNA ligase [Acidobacteriota bacterium]